jgi:beta-xylosidase
MERHRMKLKNPLLILCIGVLSLLNGSSAQAPRVPVTYTNPVYASDFPDPFVLRVGETYYAYATNGGGATIQLLQSSDLVDWVYGTDAFGNLPAWATPGWTWAPEVATVPGGYAMYYTARHTESQRQCIGVATSSSPLGPFEDSSLAPLVCQLDQGGSIDASPFTDRDGRRYLYWKNDGNCCGQQTYLYVQRLSENGLQLIGEPKALIYNSEGWEGNLIEAPSVYRRGDKYYLFFSAADYGSDTYGVGYAYGYSPSGPFSKWKGNPILQSTGRVAGPGHQSILEDQNGQPWMVYHAWEQGNTGYPNGQRSLRIDRIQFKDGVPKVFPTTSRQKAPITKPGGTK